MKSFGNNQIYMNLLYSAVSFLCSYMTLFNNQSKQIINKRLHFSQSWDKTSNIVCFCYSFTYFFEKLLEKVLPPRQLLWVYGTYRRTFIIIYFVNRTFVRKKIIHRNKIQEPLKQSSQS